MAKGTPKTFSELNSLFPDNKSGNISPADARDLIATAVGHPDYVPVWPFGSDGTRSERATAVQGAIDHASSEGKAGVLVQDSYLNYDASAVTFDNDVRMIREGQVADVYDVKAYGAAGDGSADDTAAIQAAIDAAISGGAAQGIVHLPVGDYNVSSSITISDVEGLIVEGAGMGNARSGGTKIKWTGDDDTDHLFELPDIRYCRFQDFTVQVPTDTGSGGNPTLDSVFHLVHGSGGATPTARRWDSVRVRRASGSDLGGYKRAWFWDETGAGGNANNDLDLLINCQANGFAEEAALITGSQSKTHTFFHCSFNGDDHGKHLVRSSGSYTWLGGAGGGATTAAAFAQEAVVDRIIIRDFNLEECDRLYEYTPGQTTASHPVTIRAGRFATNSLNADGDVIIKSDPGNLTLEDVAFVGSNPVTLNLVSGGNNAGVRARIVGNDFKANAPTDRIFSTLKVGDGNVDVHVQGNTFSGEGGAETSADGVGLITDGDATPNVQGNHIFKTQNTGATTITDFDNGWYGKEIKVIFGDGNTTIDFTGTNLRGNAGADWSPAQNDHMACVYDGTNWYCDISDNTA